MQLPDSVTQTNREAVQTLSLSNAFGNCEISLHGGHVISYVPASDGRERLWVSDRAIFDDVSAIRGGIPVCWPWFSDSHGQDEDSLPAHGFVRKQAWRVKSCHDDENGTSVTLVPDSVQGPGFDYAAELKLVVHLGEMLSVTMVTRNLGNTAFKLGCALHTYFAVSDINTTELTGIDGDYLDKTRGFNRFATETPYRFFEETDRIHLSTPEQVVIHHGDGQTKVCSSGHNSIVVWNPWAENTKAIADMRDDGYTTMLCVETAVTGDFALEPGQTLALQQRIG